MKSKFILGFTLSLLVSIPINGQTMKEIELEVQSELESKYGISFLVDVDAFNGGDAYTYQDPYNTLSGSYLIMASGLEPDKDLIGIYKDGALLWTTEPELTSSTYRHFLGSRELNSDGKVELIFGWKLGVNPRGSFLWIVSWDGINGQLINKIDERDRPEVYSGGDVIFIPDFEVDGIYEIMTYDFYDGDEDDSNDLYFLLKWDGTHYSLYQKLHQKDLLLSQFDRKGFKVDVRAQVKKALGNNLFQYVIFNKANSLKKIEHIHLASNISSFRSISIPHDRDLFDSRYGFITLFAEGLDKEKSSLVPGDSLSFSFSTKSLIKISNYYLQSFNDFPPSASLNASDEERITDIKTNSVSGHTLGPWLPDTTMNLDSFTDTLETFRLRSCEELGWATDAEICGELEDDLSKLKTALQDQDSVQAANVLSDFIELVEQEKDASLTSEGYALLFFNAEYLAERLPQVGRKED
jgi:hypothetical protein